MVDQRPIFEARIGTVRACTCGHMSDDQCPACQALSKRSLTDMLADFGIRHERSDIEGKRALYNSRGSQLGTFDAKEAFEYLKLLKLFVPAVCKNCKDPLDEPSQIFCGMCREMGCSVTSQQDQTP